MKHWWQLMVVAGLSGVLAGCWVKQAEHDQLRADHEVLKARTELVIAQLQSWADSVKDWENFTYQTICDVAVVNGPITRYGSGTQTYCGPGDGGKPPTPPEFGAD